MIRKVLSFEIKEVADRVLEFVGSTEDVDRVGDIVMASGWQLKNYKKNPVFMWAHQYESPPVGKAVKVWIDDNRLKFHIEFAKREDYEFADTIYKLYKGGFLRATSVGFMPIESEPIEIKDEDTMMGHVPTRFLKQDLLELSGCPVPANPNALAEAKAKGLITDFWKFYPDSAEKPYPNEHSCRLNDPGKYDKFARKNCEIKHEGKCIDVIYGIKDNKSEIQAYRYSKDIWTAEAAKSHCQSHDGTFEVASGEASTSTVSIITAGQVSDNLLRCSDIPPQEKKVSQADIADDIDYLKIEIGEVGINEDNTKLAWELMRQIMRLSGSDIPVDIVERFNKKPEYTEDRVRAIAEAAAEAVVNQAKGKLKR